MIIKNFVPYCSEALRYAKVWGRDIVRSLTLAYAKRLFPDSNPWPTSHQGTTLPLHQGSPSPRENDNVEKKSIYLKWEPLQIALISLLQRWKEQYFVNVGTDCGLTIAGFYYICFSCSDGSISGFYYDPNSRCSPLMFPIGLFTYCGPCFSALNFSKLISLMHVLIRSFSIFYCLSLF